MYVTHNRTHSLFFVYIYMGNRERFTCHPCMCGPVTGFRVHHLIYVEQKIRKYFWEVKKKKVEGKIRIWYLVVKTTR